MTTAAAVTTRRAVITLERTRGFRWASAERGPVRAHAVGFAADGDRALDSGALAGRFASLAGEPHAIAQAAVELLRRLPGGCAVVIESPDAVIALTDHIRSFPLYYGVEGDTLVLSDDADFVRRRLRAAEIDPDAVTELMLAGYVTGADTVVRGVRQTQHGECLTWTWPAHPGGSAAMEMRADRHYRFLPVGPDADPAAVDRRLADAIDLAFERFAVTVRGRRVVVPLSGGCDSRVVACMLVRHGLRDVVCYSYGRSDSLEAARSQAVANALGLRWVFTPYTYRFCRAMNRLARVAPLVRYAHGFASAPHLQDWPALCDLIDRGELREGDVVVPGHTDVVNGSHTPALCMAPGSVGLNDLIDELLTRHYNLWDWRNVDPMIGPMLRSRIADRLPPIAVRTGSDAARAADAWNVQERQAKYICHSVRSYELLGMEWRIPLTDPAWMAATGASPLALRYQRRAYWAMIDRHLFGPLGVGIDQIAAVASPMPRSLPARVASAVFRRGVRLLPPEDRSVAEAIWQPNFARLGPIGVIRLLLAYSRRFDGHGDLRSRARTLSIAMSTWLALTDMIRRIHHDRSD